MAKPTLRDVARSTGYSVATVSRVLAGNRRVGPEAERAVTEAATRLGYRPNQAARVLRGGTTGTVGLVVPQFTDPFFPALVGALEPVLHAQGRALVLADADGDVAREAGRIDALLDRQIDALLVTPVDEEASRTAVLRAAERVPLVLLDRGAGPGVADSVAVDNGAGLALVLAHLAVLGRRRVCFAGAAGPSSTAAERRGAYWRLVRRLDPEGGAEQRMALGDFSAEWGATAVDRLWPLRPDALVCANDLIAIGALRRLRQLGVDVPGEVVVTGFDDIPLAGLADPPLTTVRQPVRELAREAGRLLAERQAGQAGAGSAGSAASSSAPHRTVRLAPELVVRASTAGGPEALPPPDSRR
jgi:LacI family transcriptional regulator